MLELITWLVTGQFPGRGSVRYVGMRQNSCLMIVDVTVCSWKPYWYFGGRCVCGREALLGDEDSKFDWHAKLLSYYIAFVIRLFQKFCPLL